MRTWLILFALAILALAPASVQAQATRPPEVTLSLLRDNDHARLTPGGTESMKLRVAIEYPPFTYCMGTLRMDLRVAQQPGYASVTIEPASFVVRINQEPQPLPGGTVTAYPPRYFSRLDVTVSSDAPAMAVGLYGVVADLVPPEDPACNVRPAQTGIGFGLVNDYRPNTTVVPVGWHPTYPQFYTLELRNAANGPTLISIEAFRYDPMAMAPPIGGDVVLRPNSTGLFGIRFASVEPGPQTAEFVVKSRFDGGASDVATEEDRITINTEGQEFPPGLAPAGAASAAGLPVLLVALLGLALARRRPV